MPVFNVTVDDTSPLIVYNGYWSDSSHNDHLWSNFTNGTYHATDQHNATAALIFNGSAIYVFGALRSDNDQYLVILDDKNKTGNGYHRPAEFQQPLFTAENLDNSKHHITLENQYTTSSSSWVDLDYIVFTSGDGDSQTQPVDTVWDDTNPSIEYSPNWSTVNGPSYYGSTAHQTVNISATATMPFHGNSIALYGSTGTNHGIFNVSLDGVVPLTLNGTAPVSRYGVLLYYAGGLSDDLHILTLTNGDGTLLDLDKVVISLWNGTGPPTPDSTTSQSVPRASVVPPSGKDTHPHHPGDSHGFSDHHHTLVGPIVGGVLGGLAILAIGILSALLYVARRRHHRLRRLHGTAVDAQQISSETTDSAGALRSIDREETPEWSLPDAPRIHSSMQPEIYPNLSLLSDLATPEPKHLAGEYVQEAFHEEAGHAL